MDVRMPQLGESVVEGTVTKWLKAVGDRVEEFDALVEINTDKVDTEIPSPAAGVLAEILVAAGSTAQAGAVLARLNTGDSALAGAPAIKNEQKNQAAPARAEPLQETRLLTKPTASGGTAQAADLRAIEYAEVRPGQHPGLGFISPLVARIAAEQKIDLNQVKGSGMNGRITREDVERFAAERERAAKASAAQPASTGSAAPGGAAAPGDQILPLSSVRRAIAEHMVFSERTSPHVTTVMEADLSRVTAHRQANKAAFAENSVNLTFTAYFMAAAVAALKAFPIVNSSWSDQGIILHKAVNIGMATSLGEEGLIVPVIKQADGLSLLGLARAVNDLAGRARAHKLLPDEVRGGTFTITNHGTTGSLFATPIINQPQCAILGVGAVQKRVVVVRDGLNDAIAIRPMVYISLTFDHRILDGAIGDNFLAKVVESLENY